MLFPSLCLAAPSVNNLVYIKNSAGVIVNPDSPLKWCGDSSYIVQRVDSVELSPYPAVAGQNIVVSVSGSTNAEVVQGANIHVVSKLGPITVNTQDVDLCKIASGDQQCPVPAGDRQFKLTQLIPSIAPAGKIHLDVQITNGDEQKTKVACLTGFIDIIKPQ